MADWKLYRIVTPWHVDPASGKTLLTPEHLPTITTATEGQDARLWPLSVEDGVVKIAAVQVTSDYATSEGPWTRWQTLPVALEYVATGWDVVSPFGDDRHFATVVEAMAYAVHVAGEDEEAHEEEVVA